MFGFFGKRRRAELRAAPFPEAWAVVLDGLPLVRELSAEDRRVLEGHVAVFVADKHFEGAGGLELDDEQCVVIAAQACLLLLGQDVDEPYPSLDTVLVYPRTWRTHASRTEDGLVHEREERRSGESWKRGLVILAWDEVRRGATDEDDGQNVVLHEFAHQLDTALGPADGLPPLPERAMYAPWARVLGREYADLVARIHAGRPADIDAYGATSPAEFFAVVTEAFFERPTALKRQHPDLYEQLAAFYKQDPAAREPRADGG